MGIIPSGVVPFLCLVSIAFVLAVTAQVTENDFATLLDQRIRRMEQAKLIEHRPQPPVEAPKKRILDRFNRRI